MAAHQAHLPGILQARILEWVAISFSNAWKWKWSRSVAPDSSHPHGLEPTRLLRPWDFPGKSTGVCCHCLLPNKAEVDVFLELSCFFNDPMDVGNLISGSSAFSKSSLNIWKFTVYILLKPGWQNFDIALLVCEMHAVVHWFEHSLALSFFGIGMKTELFQSCGHCWVFQICWHIECSTFIASYFKIWNSSTGIPSPPLAL